MNVKFIKIWICFVIIFLSFVNGNHQPPGKKIVKIEEDPLIDKITKVNHNLKLVKLKKVKKVYSNLPDDEELDQPNDDHISKRPTIVDLNTKNNIATQTPISFLILDKPIKNDHQNDLKNNNLIGNKLLDELIRDHHKLPNDLITNKLPDNLKEKTDSLNDDLKIISPNENSSSNIKLNKELDKKNSKNDKNDNKTQTNKSIKKLFPSVNKFKQLNLNKSTLSSLSKATTINPFASNKSTFKTEFLNKITTKKSNYTTTTIKPITNQIKKFINPKPDRFKAFTTTTIEPPRTYATYRPNKKTTTFTPYIYSTTTSSTIEPIFRIRKSKPTTIKTETSQTSRPTTIQTIRTTTSQTSKPSTSQTIRTTTSQTIKPIAITSKPFLNNNNKFNYKNEFKNDKQTTKSPNTDKSDLETHNSSRKYAKLFLNNRRSNDQVTASSFMKYTTKFYTTTTTPLPIEISTTSYLRTNSRIATFTSYLPYSTDYTTTTIIPEFKKNLDLSTESSIKNEIDKEKILTASRKKPIIRPRRVRPNQFDQLNKTPLPKLEMTTENPILTTTYSPKFRSTTIYPLRFRSTTQTSSTKYLNQFRTSTTIPITTNDELKHKEFKLYKNLDRDFKVTDFPIRNELPIKLSTDLPMKIINESPIRSTTELPATSRFYNEKDDLYSKNDLAYNLIPRKSKWVLKDDKETGHKKSDSSYAYNMNDYTQPIRTTTITTIEQTTSRPISYVTTINSIELKNKFDTDLDKRLNEISDNKIIDRAPKSLDNLYQMRRPQQFLISNQNKGEQLSILKNLKYEEPKRNMDSNTENPDKEIYYKDTKVRKESKLVPQTYFYPTNAPSLNELNDKLSYLNEAKLKYQRPHLNEKRLENKKYEKPINLENKLNEDDPKFRYPNLPNNIPYHLPNKYHNINDNNENDQKNYLENDNRLPYIKTHFNLGHQSNNSPKYGSILNQVSNQVGKLSKPFSNQSPLPFFQPTKSDQNSNDELRYTIKDDKYKEHENDKNVHRVVDLRPFDFKNYQPLPNAKFIRTDLDSERMVKNSPTDYEKSIDNIHYSNPSIIENEKYKPNKITSYKPTNVYPYNKDYRINEIEDNISPNKLIDFNKYDKKDDTHYQKPKDYTDYKQPVNINHNNLIDHDKIVADYRPIEHRPIDYNQYEKSELDNNRFNKPINNYYNKPIENTRPLTNDQPTYNTHLDYLNNNDLNKYNVPHPTEYSNLNSNDKNVKFNLNRIPAKVVYDRYNQQFSGPISLKPTKYPPTSKHYAEIPKNIPPIEYQRKPLLPIINPTIETYKTPKYKPIYNDYNNNYQNNKLPINKPNYDEYDRDKSYRLNYDEFNRDKSYKPNYNEFNRDQQYKPVYDGKPIYNENAVYNHPNRLPNYPVNNYPVNNYQKPNKITNPINKDKQIYNHANNYKSTNQNNMRFNNPNNYKEFERDYRSSPVYYNQNKPIYYNQFINHQQSLNPNNQFREENNLINQDNNQYNAGHYNNRIYLKPTKDVELINLSDITPNLSLFKNRIPDFQLLQNTVISHDIPIVKNYNLKKK